MKALERELRERFGARIRSAMPLAELTSFRIGGPADLFVTVADENEVMNAGAFGGEIAKVVTLVHGVAEVGEAIALTTDEVKFAYRRTELPAHFVITRVDFELGRGDRAQLMARVAELKAKRASRQPGGVPNAGSIFKNPPGKFVGKLLEGAGLKGTRLGGAAFSDQHANFIVNLGGAQAAEVRALIDMARVKVKEQSGVWLEPEVRLVGDW